jgi:hypothetical protein
MATNGSFTPPAAPLNPDNKHESVSYIYSVAAAAASFSVVSNPAVPVNAFTVFNYSDNTVRGTITWSAGVTVAGTDNTFIIPPRGVYSPDFSMSNVRAIPSQIDAVDSVKLDLIDISTYTGLTAAAPALASAQAGSILVNYVAA